MVAGTVLALLAALVLIAGGAAEGKKKKGKKKKKPAPVAKVVSDKQHLILEGGQISLTATNAKGRAIAVHAISNGVDVGPVTGSAQAGGSPSMSLPLTAAGRSRLEGCSVDALAADVGNKAKKKKKKKK